MRHHVHIHAAFDAWKAEARKLLAAGIEPGDVAWSDDRQPLMLGWNSNPLPPVAKDFRPNVPRAFVEVAKTVSYHRDESRWPVLYRVLFRILHGEHELMKMDLDDDIARLTSFERSVRRDRHKMTAFVRFRKIDRDNEEWFIAWHRPDHYIVPLVAPFFRERFATMNFSILTPDDSVTWDQQELRFGLGVSRDQAPAADELEGMWKTYYASIFNPARIKLNAMRKEMPVRYWAAMPETQLIPDLLAGASQRVAAMAARQRKIATPAGTDGLPPGDAEHYGIPPVPKTKSLKTLQQASLQCRACDWAVRCTQTVFGDGSPDARVVFVGEQPGDIEDIKGEPFVGPAGQLLNQIMEEVGIDRSQIYVTNAVKHFKFEPRGKRRIHQTPSARDVTTCFPWLKAELEIIKPQILVVLGATAARALYGHGFRVTQSHGQFFTSDHSAQSVATFHPSMLLRIPDASAREKSTREFTDDLRVVKAAMDKLK